MPIRFLCAGLLALTAVACGGPVNCAPGEVPNAALQGCVIPVQCDGGVVDARNVCDRTAKSSQEADASRSMGSPSDDAASGRSGMRGDGTAGSGGEADAGQAGPAGNGAQGGQGAQGAASRNGVTGGQGGSSASQPDRAGAGGAPPSKGSACGNGQRDPGETCDGDCPTQCPAPSACMKSTLAGSPDRCDAMCISSSITSCVAADGCCPSGCTPATDSDCRNVSPRLVPLDFIATGISEDGATVVGSSSAGACVWTEATGPVQLPMPAGGGSVASKIRGGAIYGSTNSPNGAAVGTVWRWNGSVTGMTLYPPPSGYTSSRVAFANAAGAIGEIAADGGFYHAAKWDSAGTAQPLETTYHDSSVKWVTSDGEVAVGTVTSGDDVINHPVVTAYRWTLSGGIVVLPTPSGSLSFANWVSPNGTDVFGLLRTIMTVNNSSTRDDQVVRWTGDGQPVLLGIPGDVDAVNADESVVVAEQDDPNSNTNITLLVWTATAGSRPLTTLLANVDLSTWKAMVARAISDDGKTIVGTGLHSGAMQGWLAHLP
jgi:hypothetical protein